MLCSLLGTWMFIVLCSLLCELGSCILSRLGRSLLSCSMGSGVLNRLWRKALRSGERR